jgi:hypothetical protein
MLTNNKEGASPLTLTRISRGGSVVKKTRLTIRNMDALMKPQVKSHITQVIRAPNSSPQSVVSSNTGTSIIRNLLGGNPANAANSSVPQANTQAQVIPAQRALPSFNSNNISSNLSPQMQMQSEIE